MDPDSGRMPPDGGASAGERGAEKRPRRRKGKRGGKNRNAKASLHASSAAQADPAARPEKKQDLSRQDVGKRDVAKPDAARPHAAKPDVAKSDVSRQDQPARKRKRRRSKSHSDKNADHAIQHAGERSHADGRGGSVQGQAGAHAHGGAHQQNGPDGKGHGGRGQAEKNQGGKGRDRRKKNRGGRGLQGRPLTQAKSALNGVSQPALSRTMPSAEHGGAITPALHSVEATLPFHDDLYAALDLGTNNCRLLIAQPTRPGHFRVVDAFSRIVRLGEGLAATGRLSTDAMDRAVEALRICALKLSAKPIRKMRLIATEACRAAANGEEFLARVTAETGLDLEIIDRETEARLAVSGCSSLVGREARSIVLFDIGGGSSEIAVIKIGDNRSSRLANHITHWTSLPVGVVTLSERYGGRDVTPDVFEAMVSEVEGMLTRFDCPPADANADYDFHLIGTSGTVTTLAGVHLDLPRYDRRRVDGLWLSDAEVSAMQAKLLSWDFAGRAANPCIGPDRADLVLAGCAILEAIRRRWPSPRLRVADRGLREGLLTDMMADDGVWRRVRSRRSGSTGSGEVLRRR